MPELTEEMYCHQQICIPPTFPYLLRQYAKAAIRSQPVDLLKWSTAYFRCLSLNIPPPVKPRLEYPIPRDYLGITPGWLKALNYQLQNNLTVPFKILWDRWMGSCLQHDVLIKVLCLGGFTDNMAIPWNRFLGLCAGHLTDNLTQTMILFCEIISEEPEGGSAMIPLSVFLDVYKFLAAIDASQPQTLLNLFFTDAALNLKEKEKKKARKMAVAEEIKSVESSAPTTEEVHEEQEPEMTELGEGSVVSCPDIASDEALQEPELAEAPMKYDYGRGSDVFVVHKEETDMDDEDKLDEGDASFDRTVSETDQAFKMQDTGDEEGEEKKDEDDEDKMSKTSDAGSEEKANKEDDFDETEPKEQEDKDEEGDKDEIERIEKELVEGKTTESQLKMLEQDILEKGGIEIDEDVERADETSKASETYEEPQPDKEEKMEEIRGEGSVCMGFDELEHHIKLKYQDVGVHEDMLHEEAVAEEEEEEEPPEEVFVDAIPGIGPIVPEELIEAVVKHLTKVSAEEHGMTMPRHVRHYTCPPLEVQQ